MYDEYVVLHRVTDSNQWPNKCANSYKSSLHDAVQCLYIYEQFLFTRTGYYWGLCLKVRQRL